MAFMKIIFLIFVSLFYASCKNSSHDIFLGTWQKDSSTNGPTSRFSSPYESGVLVFKKNGTYTYSWSADDVSGSDRGKYFITDSINGLKFLKLERRSEHYIYYTILEVDRRRLKVKSRYNYEVGDSIIYYDIVDIFRKKESNK